MTNLCEKYFLDDYLSKTLEQNLVSGGATFIDGNVLIEDLDEKFEVYTDYCHLTIEANKFIADNIADSIFLKKLIRWNYF